MNDPLILEMASHWATRLLKEQPDVESRLQQIYQAAFARPAEDEEIRLAKEFLKVQAQELQLKESEIATSQVLWRDLCHVVFNAKQFIYLD